MFWTDAKKKIDQWYRYEEGRGDQVINPQTGQPIQQTGDKKCLSWDDTGNKFVKKLCGNTGRFMCKFLVPSSNGTRALNFCKYNS